MHRSRLGIAAFALAMAVMPASASAQRNAEDVAVSGSAAIVRTILKHGATTFTDYFVLLKVNGQWKIANKVYHAERAGS